MLRVPVQAGPGGGRRGRGGGRAGGEGRGSGDGGSDLSGVSPGLTSLGLV